ncbi:PEP-CTERM sorting domain-containing protein [Pseudoduganella sp. R-34]|uniref:PEP-CTERM sorting domain-containing protein n=1 Tax=unclassified Pseudoduganella TaxID=2637179 RepID=UPI003CF3347B
MFSSWKRCGLLAVALLMSASAQAGLLTFEDQDPGDWVAPLEAGYGGFEWGNDPAVVFKDYIQSRGYQLGTVGNVGLIGWDGIISFSRATKFNFDRAAITAAWSMDEDVLVQGWRNGQLLYTKTLQTSFNGPYYFDFGFKGVDAVSFLGTGGIDAGSQDGAGPQLVLDQIQWSVDQVDPPGDVPEPATLPLMAGGLGLLALARRRRS